MTHWQTIHYAVTARTQDACIYLAAMAFGNSMLAFHSDIEDAHNEAKGWY